MSDSPLSHEDAWDEARAAADALPPDEQPRTHAHDDYLAQTEDTYTEPRTSNVASTTTSDVAGAGPYDPSGYTIDDVKQYVIDNPDQRDAVWEAEESGKNRTGLIDWFNTQSTT